MVGLKYLGGLALFTDKKYHSHSSFVWAEMLAESRTIEMDSARCRSCEKEAQALNRYKTLALQRDYPSFSLR